MLEEGRSATITLSAVSSGRTPAAQGACAMKRCNGHAPSAAHRVAAYYRVINHRLISVCRDDALARGWIGISLAGGKATHLRGHGANKQRRGARCASISQRPCTGGICSVGCLVYAARQQKPRHMAWRGNGLARETDARAAAHGGGRTASGSALLLPLLRRRGAGGLAASFAALLLLSAHFRT